MRRIRAWRFAAGVTAAAAAGWIAPLCIAWAAGIVQVSQKDRAFRPKEVSLARGDTLRVVNDDGELVHHAYIKSDSFNFDSGEQAPGSHADITMTTAGTFTVLCAIHPKMRLTVTVK